MLTRLQVNGFKNLIDVDIRFGPFTCIAGANGAGKSNLFDAICFLSDLAKKPLLEAAFSVRSEVTKNADIRNIFHHQGHEYGKVISFIADMLIPPNAIDDLGQTAKASFTFLRYSLDIQYRGSREESAPLEIIKEDLVHLSKGDAGKNLLFKFSSKWKDSVIAGKKGTPLISTSEGEKGKIIRLHQDQKRGGKAQSFLASTLPRTVLSSANAAESPTVLCARREIESWMLLQLEPSSLRKPDPFTAPTHLSNSGENIAATLNRLGEAQFQKVANTLSELIDDVRDIKIDKDEKREMYTILVSAKGGTEYPAQSLSDGTLRFLALSILRLDPEARGLICLEEPENGIHPARIPRMIGLLQDMAVDCDEPVDDTNPLRQVIVNTHSPTVVAEVPDDSLILVQNIPVSSERAFSMGAAFSALPRTWREKDPNFGTISKGQLLSYLNPFVSNESERRETKRVIDREDCIQLSFLPALCEDRKPYGE